MVRKMYRWQRVYSGPMQEVKRWSGGSGSGSFESTVMQVTR